MDTENQMNQCEYADTALEHYMKLHQRLKDENEELKKQLLRLLNLLEEK